MEPIEETKTTPPTAEEAKKEDQFEKGLVDRDNYSPHRLSLFTKLLLGGLLVFGMIIFYIIHISGYGHVGSYGQSVVPVVVTPTTNP